MELHGGGLGLRVGFERSSAANILYAVKSRSKFLGFGGGLKYAGRACATCCSAERPNRAEAAQARLAFPA